jgi:hypothetical protein
MLWFEYEMSPWAHVNTWSPAVGAILGVFSKL